MNLIQAMDLIYGEEEPSMASVFEALRGHLSFSSGVFMPIDPTVWQLGEGHVHDAAIDLHPEYLEHFQMLDPYVIRGSALKAPNQAIRFSDIDDIASVWKSEFGSFMQRVPYFHALAIVPFLKGVPLGVFAIHRRRNQQDFDMVEQERFRSYFQHVANGIEYRRLHVEHGPAILTQYVVMSRAGRILAIGDESRDTLERLPSGRHFDIPGPAERPRLWRIGTHLLVIRSAALHPRSLYNGRWVTPHRRDTSLDRLEALLRLSPRTQASRVLVTLEPLDRNLQALAEITGVRFSPQESRVAALLLRGLRTERIAEVMHLSPLTLSEYLENCYRKAGIVKRTGSTKPTDFIHKILLGSLADTEA